MLRAVQIQPGEAGAMGLLMVVVGKHFTFCLLWFSGKSQLNCQNFNVCSLSNVNQALIIQLVEGHIESILSIEKTPLANFQLDSSRPTVVNFLA